MVKQTPMTHACPSTAAVSESLGEVDPSEPANDIAPVPEISILTPDFGTMATVGSQHGIICKSLKVAGFCPPQSHPHEVPRLNVSTAVLKNAQ